MVSSELRIFDSHCHLQDDRTLAHAEALLERARCAGVERLLCCGSSEADWSHVASLTERCDRLVPAFGLHPGYAQQRTPDWLTTLAERLRTCPAAAVGEIGLDHALEPRNDDEQAAVFLDQLRLAVGLRRPASIHCRRAWDALERSLDRIGPLPAGFAVHSYSGPPELVDPLVRRGAFLSFSGTVTRTNNRRARRSVALVPWDRLLIETDAPDLMPAESARAENCPAGPVNEPANALAPVRAIAELRGTTVEEVAEVTWRNACRLFGGGIVASG